MRYLKRSVFIALISALILPLSVFFYRYTDAKAQYQYNRFNTIHNTQKVLYQYEKKLNIIIRQRQKKITNNITTNINYEIALKGHGIKELYRKILYTYQGGLFFLVNAEIKSDPHSIHLAMKGFKVGGNANED